MPIEARRFVQAGLLYLVATFVAGSVMLVLEALGRPVPSVFAIEHAHLGTVGWLANIVIGIAFWMLPLNRERFPATRGRYPAGAAAWCFALLNGGLLVRLVAEPWYRLGGAPVAATGFLIAASIAQSVAIAIFVLIAWQRVRGPQTG